MIVVGIALLATLAAVIGVLYGISAGTNNRLLHHYGETSAQFQQQLQDLVRGGKEFITDLEYGDFDGDDRILLYGR